MSDIEKDLECVKEMCKKFEEVAKAELSKGTENVDTDEMYKVIDMIKDLSEVKKNVAKMHYYKSVVDAMEKSDKDDELLDKLEEYGIEGDRRFYNNYRYKTSGRYAPKGSGTRYGYTESMNYGDYYPTMRDMDRDYGRMYYAGDNPNRMVTSDRMSYYGGNGSNGGNYSSSSMNSGNSNTMNYESRYDRARRNYTETKARHSDNTSSDKEAKMKSLENYMRELSEDVSEMISGATPEEKSLLKNKLNTLSTKL